MSGILEEDENEDDSLKSSSVQSNRKKSINDQSASGTSYMNVDLTQSNMQDWNSVLDISLNPPIHNKKGEEFHASQLVKELQKYAEEAYPMSVRGENSIKKKSASLIEPNIQFVHNQSQVKETYPVVIKEVVVEEHILMPSISQNQLN